MKRPDEKQFLQHAEHFLVIDYELESFCQRHGFILDKNIHRTPCRVLRKSGNPEWIFDIYQKGYWLDIAYDEDIPHTFAVAAYYEISPSNDLYKLEFTIVENAVFAGIVEHLHEYLVKGLEVLKSWTPDTIHMQGTQVENFRRKFAK